MRLTALTLVACGLVAATLVRAQMPAFEVASVKPNTTGTRSSNRWSKGSFAATNMPLRMLISSAYGLRADRIAGAPSWIDAEGFDIIARAPADTPNNQLSLMLRSLLVERFKLAARIEMRDQPIYALVLARPDGQLGPNLRASTECRQGTGAFAPGATIPPTQPGEALTCGLRTTFSDATGAVVQGGATTLASVAGVLDGSAGRMVVDRTGLTGTYDVDLRFARSNLQTAPAAGVDLPSLFTALQEQLGLKLESTTGPMEFLLIDRIERPTPD